MARMPVDVWQWDQDRVSHALGSLVQYTHGKQALSRPEHAQKEQNADEKKTPDHN